MLAVLKPGSVDVSGEGKGGARGGVRGGAKGGARGGDKVVYKMGGKERVIVKRIGRN